VAEIIHDAFYMFSGRMLRGDVIVNGDPKVPWLLPVDVSDRIASFQFEGESTNEIVHLLVPLQTIDLGFILDTPVSQEIIKNQPFVISNEPNWPINLS
jgi:hypothetical protein